VLEYMSITAHVPNVFHHADFDSSRRKALLSSILHA
jgi:hypothetical protein